MRSRTEQAVSDDTNAKIKAFLDGYAKNFASPPDATPRKTGTGNGICQALKTSACGSTACKSTQKITSAMKMVAAAKLRRAQEQAEAARPYAERMERDARIARRFNGVLRGAPKLLAGTGKQDDASSRDDDGGSRPLRCVQFVYRPRSRADDRRAAGGWQGGQNSVCRSKGWAQVRREFAQ
jgi:hypothetical protein